MQQHILCIGRFKYDLSDKELYIGLKLNHFFMEDSYVPLLIFVLGTAVTLFAVYLYYNGWKVFQRIKRSKSWNKTKGTILEVKLGYGLNNTSDSTSIVPPIIEPLTANI